MDARSQIKDMRDKIKQTIQANKAKYQTEKEKNFKEIYNMKKQAIKKRSVNVDRTQRNNSLNYTMRIERTVREADGIINSTKFLET